MKINVLTEILDLAGKTIPDGKDKLTLRTILSKALSELPAGDKPDGKSSVEKLNLALRIVSNDEVDLSIEDSQMLMDLVGKMYMPLVAGRVWHILDPTLDPAVKATIDSKMKT